MSVLHCNLRYRHTAPCRFYYVEQRANRLFNWRVWVGAVMIKYINVFKFHALMALIDAGHKIFAAAMIAIGALPHIIACLGGNDQLVTVRAPVSFHMSAEVALSFAIGRTGIVGKVEVCDAAVKCGAQNAPLNAERGDITEIMP